MPKFSKGHYEVIAKVLNEYKPAGWGYISDESQAKYDTAQYIAEDLSNLFQKDNPSFNNVLFMKACGFPVKV